MTCPRLTQKIIKIENNQIVLQDLAAAIVNAASFSTCYKVSLVRSISLRMWTWKLHLISKFSSFSFKVFIIFTCNVTEIGIFDTPCNTSSDDHVSVLREMHSQGGPGPEFWWRLSAQFDLLCHWYLCTHWQACPDSRGTVAACTDICGGKVLGWGHRGGGRPDWGCDILTRGGLLTGHWGWTSLPRCARCPGWTRTGSAGHLPPL